MSNTPRQLKLVAQLRNRVRAEPELLEHVKLVEERDINEVLEGFMLVSHALHEEIYATVSCVNRYGVDFVELQDRGAGADHNGITVTIPVVEKTSVRWADGFFKNFCTRLWNRYANDRDESDAGDFDFACRDEFDEDDD